MTIDFRIQPPLVLRSPHLQTVLSSRAVRGLGRVGRALLDSAERVTIDCRDGVRLVALVNSTDTPAPLVILLHGWLGNADSPYSRRAASALHRAGFRIARLLLRDHGDTAALNPEMFHSARIDEVVDACNALSRRYGNGRTGVLGFSLGGNFAVRVAAHPQADPSIAAVLAICPVIDPAAAVTAIDSGWVGYRWWFLRRWRRALAAKQAAFPDRYDFTDALSLPTIAGLTDYVIPRHSEFPDTECYYAAYRLTHEVIARLRTPVHVVAALDDPVIPGKDVETLVETDRLSVTRSPYGGHCAFIETFGLESRLNAAAPRYFARALGL
jgi:predicted alpha/beta-fold hydrolase